MEKKLIGVRVRLAGGYTKNGQSLQSEYPEAAQDIEMLLARIEELKLRVNYWFDAYNTRIRVESE
jgi:hypothetical protein